MAVHVNIETITCAGYTIKRNHPTTAPLMKQGYYHHVMCGFCRVSVHCLLYVDIQAYIIARHKKSF